VYLDGAGWVPFEPTPGRGNPDATQLTGVAPAQDGQAVSTAPATTTTTALGSGITPTTVATDGRVDLQDTARRVAPVASEGTGRAGWVLLGLVGLLVVALAGRLGWVAMRRRRRRGSTSTPDGRARAAWVEACDWLEVVRLRRRPDETPSEFGARASDAVDLAELRRLADVETLRLFGDRPIDAADADVAQEVADQVRTTVLTRTDRRRRIEHALGWPRQN
jgi:hypothetical protein